MMKKKTVEVWNFKSVRYQVDADGDVTLIFCKECGEFYSRPVEETILKAKFKSNFLVQAMTFVNGTTTIKKENFQQHILREIHKTAFLALKDEEITKNETAQVLLSMIIEKKKKAGSN